MGDDQLTRRTLLRRASGLLVAGAAGLVALPHEARAAPHNPNCHAPFGPLHRFLWATAPEPLWQDSILWRESNWTPGAINPSSGAAGLAQFMPYTWAWGSDRFGIGGSPLDPYAAIAMMNAFVAAGEFYHWYE